jgi:hypothetical protein
VIRDKCLRLRMVTMRKLRTLIRTAVPCTMALDRVYSVSQELQKLSTSALSRANAFSLKRLRLRDLPDG